MNAFTLTLLQVTVVVTLRYIHVMYFMLFIQGPSEALPISYNLLAFNFLYLLPCKVTTMSFLMMYSSSSLCTLTYVLSSSIHFVTYTHNHILLLPNIFFMSIRVGKLNWLLMGCCKLCNIFLMNQRNFVRP